MGKFKYPTHQINFCTQGALGCLSYAGFEVMIDNDGGDKPHLNKGEPMLSLETAFASAQQGILICDAEGCIFDFNPCYADFIGKSLEELRGRKITELRPGSLIPKVLSTGKPVEGGFRKEKEEEYFANIYPIISDGQIIGTISIVTFLDRALGIQQKLQELEDEKDQLREQMKQHNGTRYTFDSIIGNTETTREAVERAKRAAKHPVNVLLQGESGCGKELFAQSIHNASDRSDGPFVAVNCAALSKSMLESELFGYEGGAFTGAKKGGKPGLFEAAAGGTLFLDEISEMDYELQAKLLRVLQERKFRRIGGVKEIDVDVRVISACNVDLLQYIDEKKFRMDLYYRIAVFPLWIPPLRERKGDLPDLIRTFLKTTGIQNKHRYYLSEEAKKALLAYNYPGNIRELRNIIEYSSMMAENNEISVSCLPLSILRFLHREVAFEVNGKKENSEKVYYGAERGRFSGKGEQVTGESEAAQAVHSESEDSRQWEGHVFANHETLSQRVKYYERMEIEKALEKYGRDTEGKRKAARELGISLSSLYNKIS